MRLEFCESPNSYVGRITEGSSWGVGDWGRLGALVCGEPQTCFCVSILNE